MFATTSGRFAAALSAVLACQLAGCRPLTPVERDALRLPADTAGDLSAIERREMLRALKRRGGGPSTSGGVGRLVLERPGVTGPAAAQRLSLLRVPAEGEPAALAVVVQRTAGGSAPESQLSLLTTEAAVYRRARSGTWRPLAEERRPLTWLLHPDIPAVDGVAAGKAAWRASWDGASWQLRALTNAGPARPGGMPARPVPADDSEG